MNEPIDIVHYGMYRLGLTDDEIKHYLRERAQSINASTKHDTEQLFLRFCRIAGSNTCPVAEDGTILMFRHDVQRFADVMFEGKPTYFD